MFQRLLTKPIDMNQSFFLFGPRGTGKTVWVKTNFPNALYFDLLDTTTYHPFLANPGKLADSIPDHFSDWIVIDEVQKVPTLLNEVHRLIETYRYKFILTGSSARQLRKKGVNLLAGRALTFHMHPLTASEMQEKFDLKQALTFGLLPEATQTQEPKLFLDAYLTTYLKEEIMQEGLTRNLDAFARFLEIASFSQGSPINMSSIARETSTSQRVINNYFNILNDLLIGYQLPIFTRRAKRRLIAHPKFYYFDTGVFRNIRPMGPFDLPEQIEGMALETLFLQHLRAYNDYLNLDYSLHYWQTHEGQEVDFVLYGPRGLVAFEIKRKRFVDKKDLKHLRLFQSDYPIAKCYLLYGGTMREYHNDIQVIPFLDALKDLQNLI